MVEVGDYTISDIYQGGYSSLTPSYGNVFTGYRTSTEGIGMSTDARTANILKEVSENLAAGAKSIELTQVFPEVFDSIPQDQLKEVNRLTKLAGVDISIHAPIIEPSGMTKDGFTETGRIEAERQMSQAVERSHELNPDGNIPVTFHSSASLPGQIKQKGEKEVKETLVINTDSGSIHRIPLKERYYPGEGETNVKKELEKINEDSWSSQLTNLGYTTHRAGEFIQHSKRDFVLAETEKRKGVELSLSQKQAIQEFNIGKTHLSDSYRQLKALYETAYNVANKNGEDNNKKILDELGEKIQNNVSQINKNPKDFKNIDLMQEVIEEGLNVLGDMTSPEIFQSLDKFAKERTTETFANIALNSYKKFGNKAPIITIENPPVGGAFSTGKELKEIVEKSREKFVEKAVEKGMSKSDAKRQAEKLLGVTWDVGHINMLRKYGYEAEDIVKETEKVASLVKHVHLSDNFGFEHTELPMGMGNVPIKEIMKKLEKEGYKGKKVIEALNWWQHFSPGGKQNPPFAPTLQAFGSPIYAEGGGPYWNQAIGLQQGYFSGYGQMLPQINYETFGAGFSQLPAELGGQRPGGAGGRMSGRPME